MGRVPTLLEPFFRHKNSPIKTNRFLFISEHTSVCVAYNEWENVGFSVRETERVIERGL